MPETLVFTEEEAAELYRRSPTDPASFVFTVEGGEHEGLEVELAGPDLPHADDTEHRWGGKMRKSVTRYDGGDTSVQVHGTEYEPVELAGVFDDGKFGVKGHALRMRDQLGTVRESGAIVRLDYDIDSRWGLLDAEFTEERRDKIHYKITFRPYWNEPPELQHLHKLELPPGDLASAAKSQTSALDAVAASPPGAVGVDVGSTLYGKVAKASNAMTSVLQKLEGVSSYAELDSEAAELAMRNLRAATRQIEGVLDRAKTLTATGAANTDEIGPDALVAADWTYEVEREARVTHGKIAEMMRQFLANREPTSRRFHVVGAGETLQSIAEDKLGDWSRWTEIADLNDLPTTDVDVGDRLELPPR